METKTCTKCGQEFPMSKEYFEPRKESKDGFRNQCRDCRNINRRNIYDDKYKSEDNRRWQQEEIDILNKYYEIMSNNELQEKYLNTRTISQIIDYASKKLNLHKHDDVKIYYSDGTTMGWTKEDDEYLLKNYPSTNFKEMELALGKNSFTITARAIKKGIQRDNKYSEEEINIVKKYYADNENKWIIDNFMSSRSKTEIIGLANRLGINKNDELIFQIRVDTGLKNLKCIPDQTGSNSPCWKGGTDVLRLYVRNHIRKWNKDSLKYYNNKCFISGDSENLIIHHGYSFKDILNETIKELGLTYNNDLSNYSNGELRNIIDLSNEKHYKYGFGIPLTKELHLLFHKTYGFVNYTNEQLIEFKNNYAS